MDEHTNESPDELQPLIDQPIDPVEIGHTQPIKLGTHRPDGGDLADQLDSGIAGIEPRSARQAVATDEHTFEGVPLLPPLDMARIVLTIAASLLGIIAVGTTVIEVIALSR